MSPELITAVKDRIDRGYTEEAIREELKSAGHTEEVINKVLQFVYTKGDSVAKEPPAITDLFTEGWNFVIKKIDLILALAIPSALMTLMDSFLFAENTTVSPTIAILSVLSLVWYLLVTLAAFYIIGNKERSISLTEGLTWARKHFLQFSWLYLLVTLVTIGGFFLFFIPGIIVMILTFFALYVFLKEGLQGMNAIVRSRELVRGRWWLVFQMLFKVLLLLILIGIIVGILIAIPASLIKVEAMQDLVVDVFLQFLVTPLSLVAIYIGYGIYSWLSITLENKIEDSSSVRIKYSLMAALGVMLPIAVIVASVLMPDKFNLQPEPENTSPEPNYKERLRERSEADDYSLPPLENSASSSALE